MRALRATASRRRWLLACALVAELIFAGLVVFGVGHTAPARPGPSAVVAANREVRMVNLGGPRSGMLLNRVAADIGQAIDAVDAFWGTDWPRVITVVATGSQPQFQTEAGGGPPARWADIAAVAVADRVDPARRIAIGQRIVFAPGAADMSEQALRIVLRHELFHYAARADTALDAPRWLTEGVADYVARPPTALPKVVAPPTALPSDADLDARARSVRSATTGHGGLRASSPTLTGRRRCARSTGPRAVSGMPTYPRPCTMCSAPTWRMCLSAGGSG